MKQITSLLLIFAVCFQCVKSEAIQSPFLAMSDAVTPLSNTEALSVAAVWMIHSYMHAGFDVRQQTYDHAGVGGMIGLAIFLAAVHKYLRSLAATPSDKNVKPLDPVEKEINHLESALNHTFTPKSRKLLHGYLSSSKPFLLSGEVRKRSSHGIKVYEFIIMDHVFWKNPLSTKNNLFKFRNYALNAYQRSRFFELWAASKTPAFVMSDVFKRLKTSHAKNVSESSDGSKVVYPDRFPLFLLSLLAEEKAENVLDELLEPILQESLKAHKEVLEPNPQFWRQSHMFDLRRFVTRQLLLWISSYSNNELDSSDFHHLFDLSERTGAVARLVSDLRYAYWGDIVLHRFWADEFIAMNKYTWSAAELNQIRDGINSEEMFGELSEQIVRQSILAVGPGFLDRGKFLETAALIVYTAGGGRRGNGFSLLKKIMGALIRPEMPNIKNVLLTSKRPNRQRMKPWVARIAYQFLEKWLPTVRNSSAKPDEETQRSLAHVYEVQQTAIKYGVVGNHDKIAQVIAALVDALDEVVPNLPEWWRIKIQPGLVETAAIIATRWDPGIFDLILHKPLAKPALWVHEFVRQTLDYYKQPDKIGPWLVDRVQADPFWLKGPFWEELSVNLSDHSVDLLFQWLIHVREHSGNDSASLGSMPHDYLLQDLMHHSPAGVNRMALISEDFVLESTPKTGSGHPVWMAELLKMAS